VLQYSVFVDIIFKRVKSKLTCSSKILKINHVPLHAARKKKKNLVLAISGIRLRKFGFCPIARRPLPIWASILDPNLDFVSDK